MLARRLRQDVALNLEISQAEKDDLRSLIEADFHQGILALRRAYDRVNAAAFADALTVNLGEVCGDRVSGSNGDRAADQHAGSLRCILTEWVLVGVHLNELG